MPDSAEPETSTGTDPNPMQDADVQTTFEKVMNDLEDNDDLATREIMQQTGAADVKPEPTPEPEGEEKPAEQDTEEPEAKEKETEEKADEQDPDMDRFNKLAKRGRETGEGRYQLRQERAAFEQEKAETRTIRQQAEDEKREALDIIESFKRAPIQTAKKYGVDPHVMGQEIKEALANPKAAQTNSQVSALEAKIDRLEQLITTQHEQAQQYQQDQVQAEAREAGHAEMNAYMSQESAQKAFPLASKLPEAMFRQYSRGAVETLMDAGIPLTHDSVLEVIESSLEELGPVFGKDPPPPPRDAPAPKAATPAGQRQAPSIGNDDKTSGPSGPNWDTLSLGDNEEDFVAKIKKEVASG